MTEIEFTTSSGESPLEVTRGQLLIVWYLPLDFCVGKFVEKCDGNVFALYGTFQRSTTAQFL